MINNQTVVILKNRYEDVYGTGLHLRFGGGYMLSDDTELKSRSRSSRSTPTYPDGRYRRLEPVRSVSDYQTSGWTSASTLRAGPVPAAVRGYGEGTAGLAFVDKTDVILVAPVVQLRAGRHRFYDQTAAFALGVNAGVIVQTETGREDLRARWVPLGHRQGDIDEFNGPASTPSTTRARAGRFRSSSVAGFDSATHTRSWQVITRRSRR